MWNMLDWLKRQLGVAELEQRLERLESRMIEDSRNQSTNMASAISAQLKAKLAEGLTLTGALTIVSQNGKQRIALSATDHCPGIWVYGEQGEPMVAIYKEQHQGAVVGVYGPADDQGKRRGGLDACVYYAAGLGGDIQLLTVDNRLRTVQITDGEQLHGYSKFAAQPLIGQLPPGVG